MQTKYDEWREKFIPSKSGQRHEPPWSNFRSVKSAKKKKRKAEVKAKKSGLNAHLEQFLTAKVNVNSCTKKAK